MSGGGMGMGNIGANNSAPTATAEQPAQATQNPLANIKNMPELGDTFAPNQQAGQYGTFADRIQSSQMGRGNVGNQAFGQFGGNQYAGQNDFYNTQNYINNAMQMSHGLYGSPYSQQGNAYGLSQGYQQQMPFQNYMQQSPYQFYQPQNMYQNYMPQRMYGGYQNPYGGIAGLMF